MKTFNLRFKNDGSVVFEPSISFKMCRIWTCKTFYFIKKTVPTVHKANLAGRQHLILKQHGYNDSDPSLHALLYVVMPTVNYIKINPTYHT